MDASEHFKGQRITVMGLGLLGGVGDIAFLAECGADIIATDLKNEEELAPSLEILKKYPNIRYTLGRHEHADFRNRDLIIKAPSTPLDSEYIDEARKNDIPIAMWVALFAKYAMEAGVTVIGVTGTRGKSTVTQMVYQCLKDTRDPKTIHLGGNMSGVSTLALLPHVNAGDIAVLELDSWKLQGFGELQISPQVAVFTTLFQDHLNYYKNDLDAYLADKANIFLYQNEEDTLILGQQCAPTIIDRYGDAIVSKTLVVDETRLPNDWVLQVPGVHNRYNAALAAAALEPFEEYEEIWAGLTSFKGVPGRLELVATKQKVKIYNDTNSTTPEATLAALAALGTEHTVLIMGGSDKNLDMNALLEKLGEVKKVILLAGTGTDRIKDAVSVGMIYHTLSDAVAAAFSACAPGDTLLFSPAFTSFGMFKNEYDRGDQFTELVKKL